MVLHDKYEAAPYHAYSSNLVDLGNTNSDIRVALLTSSHTKDLTNNETFSDVSADEIDPTSNDQYAAGGKAVSSISLSRSGATTTFDGANVTWTNSTIDAAHAVLYDNDTGYLLSHIDFEGTESSQNGDFSVEWDSAGIFTITANA